MESAKYVLNKIEQLDNAYKDDLFRHPTLIAGGGMMLCTKGGCDIVMNAKAYSVKRWDLIVVSPYSVVQLIALSNDFDCVIIGASLDFFSRIDHPQKGEYFINIVSHPSISLSEREAQDILELREIIIKEERCREQPLFSHIHNSLLEIITYKIFALYVSHEPNKERQQSRNNEILNAFIFDLLKYNYKERKLEFYAQRQSITASYLSRCVKSVTGRGAAELLIDGVINNIKYRLSDTTKSIAEIAEEFHFPSSSTFSQYVKTYTSLSPKEFRR